MPLLIAFIGSAMIHAAVVLGSAWELPDWNGDDTAATLEARLVPPSPAPVVAPVERKLPARPPRRSHATVPAPVAITERHGPDAATEGDATSAASTVPPEPTFDPAPVLAAYGRVRYTVTRGEDGFVVGQVLHIWRREGGTYTLESVTETTGLAAVFKPARIVQQSRGEIMAGGLRPLAFHQEDKKGTSDAALDWTTRQISYAGRNEPLPAGTQDMLSMYYQLAWLIAAQPEATAAIELPIATGRKLESYRFDFVGAESLARNGHTWRTLHFTTKNGTDTIELWFAPEVHGLPLKIRFIDRKGEIFDQLADTIDIRNELPESP